ncbi:MAG: cell division protein FtsL [Nitrospirae bacterium]|nr:cell division protein FtsL [Nitrospirota bacterium]MBI3593856.1 cell division protein FtsL [Nitrospirota bacterium]
MRNKKSSDWTYLKCGILIFSGIVVYLAYHIHVVKMGYEMSQMQKEKKILERTHTELQIEISSLSSLDRIEHIAVTQLGMVPGSSTGKIRVTELNPNNKTPSVEVAERETSRNIFK